MDNKCLEAWGAYKKTLDKPETTFVGWQNAKGTRFSLCSAKNENPPPGVGPLDAVCFFQAAAWAEANQAWYARNGWAKAG